MASGFFPYPKRKIAVIDRENITDPIKYRFSQKASMLLNISGVRQAQYAMNS